MPSRTSSFLGPPLYKSRELVREVADSESVIRSGELVTRASGPQLGKYDFALIWDEIPTDAAVKQLLRKLDEKFGASDLVYDVITGVYT